MLDSYFDINCESAIEEYLNMDDIAQEGLLFTSSVEENLDLLNSRDKGLVILTSDNKLPYGGLSKKYLLQIMNKYQFKGITTIDIMEYLMMRFNEDEVTINRKFDPNCDDGVLLSQLNKLKVDKNNFLSNIFRDVFEVIDAYVALSGKLVVIIDGYIRSYTFELMRKHPLIVTDASLISTFFKKIMDDKNLFNAINYTRTRDAIFETMNNKIPSKLIMLGKDLKYPLFHISPVGNIKDLEPRITVKPMNGENVRIARISAAPTIDACFKAIGLQIKDSKEIKRYYVYRLKIGPQVKIVKPTPKLVPDVYNTSEHWILEPVPVENYGYIEVSLGENNKYIFNDKNVRINPMITTTFYK